MDEHEPQAFKIVWNARGGCADVALTYDSSSASDYSLARLGELRAAFGASEYDAAGGAGALGDAGLVMV